MAEMHRGLNLPSITPVELGQLIESRQASLQSPKAVQVQIKPNWMSGSMTDTIPAPRHVDAMLRARSQMTWQELTENTLDLGSRWPAMLTACRVAEVEAQQLWKDEKRMRDRALQQKRRRVQKRLEQVKVQGSKGVMVVNGSGIVIKHYKSRRPVTRAAQQQQQRCKQEQL